MLGEANGTSNGSIGYIVDPTFVFEKSSAHTNQEHAGRGKDELRTNDGPRRLEGKKKDYPKSQDKVNTRKREYHRRAAIESSRCAHDVRAY